jgi:hypothetical protein
MKITGLLLASTILIAGCSTAKKSSEVAATYVPSATYKTMSCSNLRAEGDRLRRSVSDIEASVDAEYKKDKNMELVTWLLFWPAAFAMDGNDAEAKRLADAKGEADAIRSAMIAKGCRM